MLLETLLALLEPRIGAGAPYKIPGLWIAPFDGTRFDMQEQTVEPYRFFSERLRELLGRSSVPCESRQEKLCFYGMFVRAQTAYVHADGVYTPGSFLKSIMLLPYLRGMGVNLIYLLPVLRLGRAHAKGELGSPYATKDFTALEPTLHDPLLEGDTLDLEFGAFVEACHRVGMKVMLDMVFRTCARDHALIRTHPDWFYWVHLDGAPFRPPRVPALGMNTRLTKENVSAVYQSPELPVYREHFSHDPRAVDPVKWAEIVSEEDLLAAIEREYRLTTAPAFSDCVNDPQPLWTDVTYLRYDLAQKQTAAPSLLFDTIKCNLFPPSQPNAGLYGQITEILPGLIRRFGVDGARVDMAHALPQELLLQVIRRAKEENPEFLFWSEVFDPGEADEEKQKGFQFITGGVWELYLRLDDPAFNRQLKRQLESALPVMAAPELPDAPRICAAAPEEARQALLVFNALLPRSVPFISSGLELSERQSMNLGLAPDKQNPDILPEEDPMRGKLAFFDRTVFHWQAKNLVEEIRRSLALRAEFSPFLSEPPQFPAKCPGTLTAMRLGEEAGLVLLFNRSAKGQTVRLARLFPELQDKIFTLRYHAAGYINQTCTQMCLLAPYEVRVMTFEQ